MILLDLQFEVFLKSATDFNDMKVSMVFDMLDVDSSGIIDFDEFYLLICILIAVKVLYIYTMNNPCNIIIIFLKDGVEKQFISCHSRTVFDLLDRDGDGLISIDEFEAFGFLFNIEVRPLPPATFSLFIIY